MGALSKVRVCGAGGTLGHLLVVENADSKGQYCLIFQEKPEAHFLCEIMNL